MFDAMFDDLCGNFLTNVWPRISFENNFRIVDNPGAILPTCWK
jgi:hypothetical protein